MSLFTPSPRRGDWVTATGTIPTSPTDHLLGSGIQSGARGVVVDGPHGWLHPSVTVRFDSGFGDLREVDAPLSKLRLRRRGGGLDLFTERVRWMGLFRLGVAAALCLPVLYFVLVYLWTFHTVDGLLPALVGGALDSAASMVDFAITRPLQAAVFLLISWGLGRFAFR